MKQAIRQQRHRKRYLYLVAGTVFCLGGIALLAWWLPFTLADYGRLYKVLTGGEAEKPVFDQATAQPLRGTIYDRNFTELAVSYRLYTLYVHPAELKQKEEAAKKLVRYAGGDVNALLDVFRFSQRAVKIADALDEHQARGIAALHLAGVFTVPVEQRFYPAHTAAAHIVGFSEKQRGLSGVEAWFDTVLQPGEFRSDDVPALEVDGRISLGRTTTDVVLTLDLDMQRRVEQKLDEYLQTVGEGEAMAMVLEPSSGRLFALALRPAFNPNYFWLAEEKARRMQAGCMELDDSLLRPLLVRAAAVRKYDHETMLLPETVAAPDFGVTPDELAAYEEAIGLHEGVDSLLTGCTRRAQQHDVTGEKAGSGLNGIQAAVTLASQLNGGWRYAPFFFESVYDHATEHFYRYRFDATAKKHVLSPTLGIKIRRSLMLDSPFGKQYGLLYSNSRTRIEHAGDRSQYVILDLAVAASPVQSPRIMLFLLGRRSTLNPLPSEASSPADMLVAAADELTPILDNLAAREDLADRPAGKNEENFRRFLISRRIDYQEKATGGEQTEQAMPSLVGLSLRKALQRLNRYDVQVRIQGSGSVISQKPQPGSLLDRQTECELVLQAVQ